jgi:hypothetical protein
MTRQAKAIILLIIGLLVLVFIVALTGSWD